MSDSKPPRPQPLWLTEQDVGACVDLNEAIAALEQGLRLEAEGKGVNVDKALATWTPASSMHALGSTMAERGFGGFKTWANTPAGPPPVSACSIRMMEGCWRSLRRDCSAH